MKYYSNELNLITRGIQSIVSAFSTSNSIYILGSGVSARYSKLQHDLISNIKTKFLSMGSFNLEKLPHDSITNKLILPSLDLYGGDELENFVLSRMPPAIIKNLIHLEYAVSEMPTMNPEYQIFLKARLFSTIIDLNHEGFSNHYLNSYHRVINLNGIADIYLSQYLKSNNDIFTLEVDFSRSHSIKTYPREKQRNDILKYTDRKHLNNKFVNLKYLVIVGYTFAKSIAGYNDSILLNFLMEKLDYDKSIKIIIIDPYPDILVNLFSRELHRLVIVPMYWDNFCDAIYECLPTNFCIDNVIRSYYKFLSSRNNMY